MLNEQVIVERIVRVEERIDSHGEKLDNITVSIKDLDIKVTNHMMHSFSYIQTTVITILSITLGILGGILFRGN